MRTVEIKFTADTAAELMAAVREFADNPKTNTHIAGVEITHEAPNLVEVPVEEKPVVFTEAPVVEEPVPVVEEPVKAEPVKVSMEDARAALNELRKAKGTTAVKDLLKEFGAENFTTLNPGDYGNVIAKAKEAL